MKNLAVGALALLAATAGLADAINVVVDYRYDTSNFFGVQQRRDALEAAAQRFSDVITTSLSAATLPDDSLDARIGFNRPDSGSSWQVSSAVSLASDAVFGASNDIAEEYRGEWSLAEDEWVLYAGARAMGSTGVGGTGTGLNFTTIYQDGSSHLNRGFRSTGSASNLPVWGGAISFDSTENWHFGVDTMAPLGAVDFYSIAARDRSRTGPEYGLGGVVG